MQSIESTVRGALSDDRPFDYSEKLFQKLLDRPSLAEYTRNVLVRTLEGGPPANPANARRIINLFLQQFPDDPELVRALASLGGSGSSKSYKDQSVLLRQLKQRKPNLLSTMDTSIVSSSRMSLVDRLTRDLEETETKPPKRRDLLSPVRSLRNSYSLNLSRITRDWSPERDVNFGQKKIDAQPTYIRANIGIKKQAGDAPQPRYFSTLKKNDDHFDDVSPVSRVLKTSNRSNWISVEKEVEIARNFRARFWFSRWRNIAGMAKNFEEGLNRLESVFARVRANAFFKSLKLELAFAKTCQIRVYHGVLRTYTMWRQFFSDSVSGRRSQVQGVQLFVGILTLLREKRVREGMAALVQFWIREKRRIKAMKLMRKFVQKMLGKYFFPKFKMGVALCHAEKKIIGVCAGIERVGPLFRARALWAMDRMKMTLGKNKKLFPFLPIGVKLLSKVMVNRGRVVLSLLGIRVKFHDQVSRLDQTMARKLKMRAVKKWSKMAREAKRSDQREGLSILDSVVRKRMFKSSVAALASLRRHMEQHTKVSLQNAFQRKSHRIQTLTEGFHAQILKRKLFSEWKRKNSIRKQMHRVINILEGQMKQRWGMMVALEKHVRDRNMSLQKGVMFVRILMLNMIRSRTCPLFKQSGKNNTSSALAIVGQSNDIKLKSNVFSVWKKIARRAKLLARVTSRIHTRTLSDSFSTLKDFFWKTEIICALRHCDRVRHQASGGSRVVMGLMARMDGFIVKQCVINWKRIVEEKKRVLLKLVIACSGKQRKRETLAVLRLATDDSVKQISSTRHTLAATVIGSIISRKVLSHLHRLVNGWKLRLFEKGFVEAQTDQDRVTRDLAEAAQFLEDEFKTTKAQNEMLNKQLAYLSNQQEDNERENQMLADQLQQALAVESQLKSDIISFREQNEILKHRYDESGEYKAIIERQRIELDKLNARIAEYSKLNSSVSFYKNKCLLQSEQITSLQSKLRESSSSPYMPASRSSGISGVRESLTPTRPTSFLHPRTAIHNAAAPSPVFSERGTRNEMHNGVLYSSPVLHSRTYVPTSMSHEFARTTPPLNRDYTPTGNTSLRHTSRLY